MSFHKSLLFPGNESGLGFVVGFQPCSKLCKTGKLFYHPHSPRKVLVPYKFSFFRHAPTTLPCRLAKQKFPHRAVWGSLRFLLNGTVLRPSFHSPGRSDRAGDPRPLVKCVFDWSRICRIRFRPCFGFLRQDNATPARYTRSDTSLYLYSIGKKGRNLDALF